MQLGLVLGLHTAAGFRQGILEEVDYADGIDLLDQKVRDGTAGIHVNPVRNLKPPLF